MAGATERLLILTPAGNRPFYGIKACDYLAATGNVFTLKTAAAFDYPSSIKTASGGFALAGKQSGKSTVILFTFDDELDISPDATIVVSSRSYDFELADMNEQLLVVYQHTDAPGLEGERYCLVYRLDTLEKAAEYRAAGPYAAALGGSFVAVAVSKDEIRVFNPDRTAAVRSIRVSQYNLPDIAGVDVSPDGRWVAYTDSAGNLFLFDEKNRPYMVHTEITEMVGLTDKYLIYQTASGLHAVNLSELTRFRFDIEPPQHTCLIGNKLICQHGSTITVFEIKR